MSIPVGTVIVLVVVALYVPSLLATRALVTSDLFGRWHKFGLALLAWTIPVIPALFIIHLHNEAPRDRPDSSGGPVPFDTTRDVDVSDQSNS